jgi:replicative DNA helicase
MAQIQNTPADPTAAVERVLPHDLLAEQSALGGMMISADAVAVVNEFIRPNDFYAPKHELIYDAILSLFGKGEPIDAISVSAELTRNGNLVRAGGADYVHSLTSFVPTAANADYYAKIVQEKAVLRRMVEVGTKIAQMGYAAEGDLEELINAAQADVYAVGTKALADQYSALSTSIDAAVLEMEIAEQSGDEMTGIATGFHELDDKTHGLHGGQMIIIAARPAVGKSTFALDISRNGAIKHNKPVLFFSLEMSKAEIAMRMLSAEAELNLSKMRGGGLSADDWKKLAAVRGRINDAPLFIDDSPNLTMIEIRAKSRRLKESLGLEMIVIDYLQLLTSGKKVESRQQEVSEFSRGIKLLAKELNIPVIAIAQLNRNSEQKADKKPEISHLRESGSLEQDADVVILLHRPDQGQKDHPRVGEAEIILAKQRNGPTGEFVALFQGQYSRFVNMPQNRHSNTSPAPAMAVPNQFNE